MLTSRASSGVRHSDAPCGPAGGDLCGISLPVLRQSGIRPPMCLANCTRASALWAALTGCALSWKKLTELRALTHHQVTMEAIQLSINFWFVTPLVFPSMAPGRERERESERAEEREREGGREGGREVPTRTHTRAHTQTHTHTHTVIHPALEGLFNIVVAWGALFFGFLRCRARPTRACPCIIP
jgi:hypothetical protein